MKTPATQAVKTDNAIDPDLIWFVVALFIVSVLVEVVDRISHEAAQTLVVIIILGLFLNNPLVTRAIFNFGSSLGKGLS